MAAVWSCSCPLIWQCNLPLSFAVAIFQSYRGGIMGDWGKEHRAEWLKREREKEKKRQRKRKKMERNKKWKKELNNERVRVSECVCALYVSTLEVLSMCGSCLWRQKWGETDWEGKIEKERRERYKAQKTVCEQWKKKKSQAFWSAKRDHQRVFSCTHWSINMKVVGSGMEPEQQAPGPSCSDGRPSRISAVRSRHRTWLHKMASKRDVSHPIL